MLGVGGGLYLVGVANPGVEIGLKIGYRDTRTACAAVSAAAFCEAKRDTSVR
jgi:hypothetical protein